MLGTWHYIAPAGASAAIAAASVVSLHDQHRSAKLSEPGCTPDFRRVFCACVRAARKATGLTQAEMARALDINQATYESYGTRTLLPHRLVGRFAAVAGVDFDDLFRLPPGRGVRL